MKIEINRGIEGIALFGDTKRKIKTLLGKPDEISREMRPNAVTYIYNDLKIRLYFDYASKKLYSIDICNGEIILFDQKLNLFSKAEYMDFLNKHGINDAVYEDGDYFESVFSSQCLLAAEFTYDRLDMVEISSDLENI